MIKIGDKIETKFKVGDEAWIVIINDPFEHSDTSLVKIKIERIKLMVFKDGMIGKIVYWYYLLNNTVPQEVHECDVFKTKSECIDYYMACVRSMLTRGE